MSRIGFTPFIKQTLSAAFLALLSTAASTAQAQGTAFTYQGRLNEGAKAASGNYDLRFAIYDASSGGTQQGSWLTNSDTAVSNGLFTVTLDFGNQFSGADRWLEIAVRTNGGGAFNTLNPRQALTPTPYAITAGNLSGALPAGQLSGAIANANLPASPTFSGAVAANSFTGNGASVTNVNAASLNGQAATNFWQLGGNSISPGQFLGSTNNQPVEVRVNGQRGMRLEATPADGSHAGIVNIINGSAQNYVSPGVRGATIAGGGADNLSFLASPNNVTGDFGTISGGFLNNCAAGATVAGGCYNVASSRYAVVSGGTNNNSWGYATTVAGGSGNTVGPNADFSAIAGGNGNMIPYGSYGFIGSGRQNYGAGDYGVLLGGAFNTNQANFTFMGAGWGNFNGGNFSVVVGGNANVNLMRWAVIAGGDHNTNNTDFGFIGGGQANYNNGYASVICGGLNNNSSGIASAVGGGWANVSSGLDSVIAGGLVNLASSQYSTVGGGEYNSATNSGATVPGGYANTAGGINSFAAGSGAKAMHSGAFVWADNQAGTFTSTTTNQFNVRAGGGIHLVTAGAGMTLDGQPVMVGNSTNAVSLTNSANIFSGNGGGLTNINAAMLGGQPAAAFAPVANPTFAGVVTTPTLTAGAVQITGLLRSGSETGTDYAPVPAGLVIRRVNSLLQSAGNIVARTDELTLERDASNEGLVIRYPAGASRQTINGLAQSYYGTNIIIRATLNSPGAAGTIQLLTSAQRAVHADISFGNTFNGGGHCTKVSIDRYDDGITSDYYWVGTVTSTFNQ